MAHNRTGVNTLPLEEFGRTFSRRNKEIRALDIFLVDRYGNFVRRRYRRLSRGGGTWPNLKAATKRQRARKGKPARRGFKGAQRKFAILFVDGDLF